MKKILVIEDEAPLREDILEILDCLDFECLGAENGVVGVKQAQEYLPDLIICDIMMPELDGYGVLKSLRQSAETAIIPLIFLSAKADKADIRQGMNMGADDYLTKPFTISELEDAIMACLEKQATRKQAQEILLESDAKSQQLTKQQELLDSLTKQIRNSSAIRNIINSTLITIRNLLQTHRCSFLVYRGNVDEPYFELVAESSDVEVANLAKSNALMEEASLGELILNQSRIELNDISQSSQLDVSSLNYLISLNYTAILAVTIQFLSGEVGVIVCEHFSKPRTWSNNEVELLQAVADQLPIAL